MATKPVNDNVIDISLSVTRKKRFRIDGDDSRIIELNTSDINVVGRLNEAYKKLIDMANNASTILDDIDTDSQDGIDKMVSTLRDIDVDMRKLIDYIFDSKISDICAPDGSMYDPFNGQFRFEHIIETLSGLYENNFDTEFKKMSTNVRKHTDKYVNKKG